MTLLTLSLKHASTVSMQDIDSLRDEGNALISALDEEIEELNEEKLDLENEDEDYNNVRLAEIAQELMEKEKEKSNIESDVSHLEHVYDTVSCYTDTAISHTFIDSYIEDNIKESYNDEIENLPNSIKNNIDWSNIVAEGKQDYSEIEIDEVTYYFC